MAQIAVTENIQGDRTGTLLKLWRLSDGKHLLLRKQAKVGSGWGDFVAGW